MPPARSSRPANRPSRRHEILTAAIDLMAVQPPDEIAVSDIAAQAGMTPAAFYYHFASKDEILDEILANFAHEWTVLMTGLLGELSIPGDLVDFIDDVLSWIDDHERAATVYFVTAIGATSHGEMMRKQTREDLSKKASRAFAVMNPAKDKVQLAVAGLGLVILVEVISRARLELDVSYRTLGPMRYRISAATLAEHLVY